MTKTPDQSPQPEWIAQDMSRINSGDAQRDAIASANDNVDAIVLGSDGVDIDKTAQQSTLEMRKVPEVDGNVTKRGIGWVALPEVGVVAPDLTTTERVAKGLPETASDWPSAQRETTQEVSPTSVTPSETVVNRNLPTAQTENWFKK